MKKKTAASVIARCMKLFGVKDQGDLRFCEWSEALGDNYELNNLIEDYMDSGKYDDEYEAAWVATGDFFTDEELLKEWEDYKDRTYDFV